MQSPQTLYRGLYVRIAQEASRGSLLCAVALPADSGIPDNRKRSPGRTGRTSGSGWGDPPPLLGKGCDSRGSRGRLKTLMRQNRSHVRKQWMGTARPIPISAASSWLRQKRTAPIWPVLDEALKVMRLSLKEMATMPMKAAQRHGHLRQAQGFSPSASDRRVQPGSALRFWSGREALASDGRAAPDARPRPIRRGPRPADPARTGKLPKNGVDLQRRPLFFRVPEQDARAYIRAAEPPLCETMAVHGGAGIPAWWASCPKCVAPTREPSALCPCDGQETSVIVVGFRRCRDFCDLAK